jgi:radical SAM superfamily enzyme YgiQ (UPF0313 family)
MEQMKETGAWKIALGVESGSDEVLKRIKKKVKVDDVVQAVTRLGQAGIQTKGFFIFGFPGETEEEIQETRGLVRTLGSLGITEFSAFQFKPYPGTEAYRQLIAEQPDLVGNLTYLRKAGQAQAGTKANARATDTPWLPDNLQIAAIPSRVVREHVKGALEDFYGSLPEDVTSCS